MNLYAGFLNTVRSNPDKVAVEFAGHRLTFTDLHRLTLGVSAALGDRRGCNVGLLVGNSPGFVSAFFGALGAGGTLVPLNALLTPPELVPIARHAEIEVLLASHQQDAQARRIADALPEVSLHWIEDIPPANPDSRGPAFGESHAADDLAVILYTSGTTGDPKGVMLTHRNFIANYESYSEAFAFRPAFSMVVVLPLFHSFAFTVQLLPCALMGCRMILFPSFKPKQVLDVLARERDLILVAVPPMYGVLTAMAPAGLDISRNLYVVVSGGGPLPREIQRQFEERFGLELKEGYGLTEAAPVVTSNDMCVPNRRGTIGVPLPRVQVQIWDETGQPQPAGVEGELVVRGENVMRGYYKNPQATAAVLCDGWLRTGDLAAIDADGYVRIVGRKKELIVSAGENIHPREIEEVLLQHPAVFEAAVVGIPDERKTEVPKAFVAPVPGQSVDTIDTRELRDFCRRYLAAHKVPTAWQVVESLPKTPTGKIAKRLLGAPADTAKSEARP